MRLLIGWDSAYTALVRAATDLHEADERSPLLVLFGTDNPFPFRPRPSTILVPGMPPGVIACVPALEEFGIASRLASPLSLPGCYDGPVIELAELWLKSHAPAQLAQIEILFSATRETVPVIEDFGRRLGLPVRVIPPQEPSP